MSDPDPDPDPGPGRTDDGATGGRPTDGGLVPLDRRVLVLWRVRAAIGAAVIAALVSLTAAGAAERPATPWLVAGPIVGAVALGVSWWWTALVWRAWRVRIGDDALHLRHGVLTRHESTIPYHRIQHIDLEAGPLERRLRLTSLILRTASATSDATVPGIDDEEAGRVRTRILARAGDGDAV